MGLYVIFCASGLAWAAVFLARLCRPHREPARSHRVVCGALGATFVGASLARDGGLLGSDDLSAVWAPLRASPAVSAMALAVLARR